MLFKFFFALFYWIFFFFLPLITRFVVVFSRYDLVLNFQIFIVEGLTLVSLSSKGCGVWYSLTGAWRSSILNGSESKSALSVSKLERQHTFVTLVHTSLVSLYASSISDRIHQNQLLCVHYPYQHRRIKVTLALSPDLPLVISM